MSEESSDSIARARSLLFVPASRPDRFFKALDTRADCVVIDLEDAVAAQQKDAAREQLANALPQFTAAQMRRTVVRINAQDTAWHRDDLGLLQTLAARGLAAVMVPKAETAASLQAIARSIGGKVRLLPLVESLAGLDAIDALARCPQVARLAFGHLDFQLDLGMECGADEHELASVRFALVAASRRAGLAPPADGVTKDTLDGGLAAAGARRARAFGFGGKLCIHPAQVDAVNQAFAPSAEDLEWARRVQAAAEAHKGEAFSLDGRMVDHPVIRKAQQILQSAG